MNELKENYNSMKIDFIGVGVERCGTSWLFECLREHPEICVSKYKEIDFFKDDEKYNKGLDYYKAFFRHCDTNSVIGEFSPRYYFSEKSFQRIKKNFPDVKLIISFRNPIEKTYSLYKMKNSYKSLPHKNFEEFIKDDRYIKRGFYAKRLKELYSLFPKENILCLIYEDIKVDSEKFIKKIYNFLGVRTDFRPKILHSIHNSPELRSPAKQAVFTVLSKLKRGVLMKSSLGRKLVYFAQQSGIYGKMETYFAKGEKNKSDREPMKDETRKYLKDLFKDDIQEMEKLLKRKLSFWK